MQRFNFLSLLFFKIDVVERDIFAVALMFGVRGIHFIDIFWRFASSSSAPVFPFIIKREFIAVDLGVVSFTLRRHPAFIIIIIVFYFY